MASKPFRSRVGIALDNQGSNPDAETDEVVLFKKTTGSCLLYTSPSPRDVEESRMPSSA